MVAGPVVDRRYLGGSDTIIMCLGSNKDENNEDVLAN